MCKKKKKAEGWCGGEGRGGSRALGGMTTARGRTGIAAAEEEERAAGTGNEARVNATRCV